MIASVRGRLSTVRRQPVDGPDARLLAHCAVRFRCGVTHCPYGRWGIAWALEERGASQQGANYAALHHFEAPPAPACA